MEKQIVTLDTSALVQFMKCKTFHNLVSVQNLTRKYTNTQMMDRGTVMHGLLQRFYHKVWEGDDWATAMNYSHEQLSVLKKEVKLEDDDYKLIVLRFNDYVVKYSDECHKIKVATMDTPQGKKPAIEIGFSVVLVDTPEKLYVLEGRIDLITIMSETLVVWDHKSQSRKYYLYGHSLQALNYLLVTGAKRFMYNYVRLHQKLQSDTLERKLSYCPQSVQVRWKRKLIETFDKVAAFQRAGIIVDDCYPNHSCSDIGFGKQCPFTSVCEEENLQRRQAIIATNFHQRTKWSPWSLEELLGEDE